MAASITDCLRVDRRLLAGDRRPRGRDVGVGLFERDLVVAVVDAGEDLAGLDRLVVAHQHRAQITRDLGSDRVVVGLNIGVVGRDLETSDRPIVPAVIGAERERREAGAAEEKPAQAAARRSRRVRAERPRSLQARPAAQAPAVGAISAVGEPAVPVSRRFGGFARNAELDRFAFRDRPIDLQGTAMMGHVAPTSCWRAAACN